MQVTIEVPEGVVAITSALVEQHRGMPPTQQELHDFFKSDYQTVYSNALNGVTVETWMKDSVESFF